MTDRVEAAIEDARRFLAISYWPTRKRWIDHRDLAAQKIADALERREQPAEWARQIVIDRLRNELARGAPRRRSRDPLGNMSRDFYITLAVNSVVQEHGFDASRSRATANKGHKDSACSIVAEALRRLGIHGVGEEAIEKIWREGVKGFARMGVGN